MNNCLLRTTLFAIAFTGATTVSAQTLKMTPYLGVTGGLSSWNVDCAGVSNCKTNPGSYRLFAGVELSEHLAVEVTGASLGTAKGGGLSIQANSYDVSAVYKFTRPNNPIGFFVKGGIDNTRAKATVINSGGTVIGADTVKAWGLLLGTGVTYAMTESFSLRGELNTQKLKVTGSSGNVTSFSFGGQGSF